MGLSAGLARFADKCQPSSTHSVVRWLQNPKALQSLNLRIETALVPGCLVLVNKPLASRMIKNRYGILQCRLGGRLVTRGNRVEDALHHGSQHRTLTRVALTGLLGLTDALSRLGGICHGLPLDLGGHYAAEHYRPVQGECQDVVVRPRQVVVRPRQAPRQALLRRVVMLGGRPRGNLRGRFRALSARWAA